MRDVQYPYWLVILLTALTGSVGCGHKTSNSNPGTFSGPCTPPQSIASLPATLAETGCFSSTGIASSSMGAYDVNVTTWADGSTKQRYLLLPQGQEANFDANGLLQVPPGTAVYKEFMRDGVKLETRIFMFDQQGMWGGANYMWNSAQTGATLLSGDVPTTSTLNGQTWTYPSRSNCLYCHNNVAGNLLGLRVPQVNFIEDSDGNTEDQLTAMFDHNLINSPVTLPATAWVDVDDMSATLEQRARSYLAANCAYCHQPGGQSGTQTNYLYDTPLSAMGICNVPPSRGNLGIPSAQLLTPGAPTHSILSLRMHSTDSSTMMPPLGRTLVDTSGVAVIDAWITSLTSCND